MAGGRRPRARRPRPPRTECTRRRSGRGPAKPEQERRSPRPGATLRSDRCAREARGLIITPIIRPTGPWFRGFPVPVERRPGAENWAILSPIEGHPRIATLNRNAAARFDFVEPVADPGIDSEGISAALKYNSVFSTSAKEAFIHQIVLETVGAVPPAAGCARRPHEVKGMPRTGTEDCRAQEMTIVARLQLQVLKTIIHHGDVVFLQRTHDDVHDLAGRNPEVSRGAFCSHLEEGLGAGGCDGRGDGGREKSEDYGGVEPHLSGERSRTEFELPLSDHLAFLCADGVRA